jgi:CDP-6-deoxy-D-xylo-4-hexulose-3-dehydrase
MKIMNGARKKILEILADSRSWQTEKFIPGKSLVRYAGAVFGEKEMQALVDSFLDGWFGVGPKTRQFEKRFAEYIGAKYALFTNSGSSANLLSISSLTSNSMGKRRIKKGEEIIVSAFCFPTTVTPILLNGLKPRFVDVELGTYTMKPENIEAAITPNTKAVMLTHHFGNPNKLKRIEEICERNGLFLIEDCCDALGAEYAGRKTGNFGIGGTFSFYPAHHITTGEGGMLVSKDEDFIRAARSIRDWGRGCFCDSRSDNVNGECGRRFSGKFGDLPVGYDHKYTYSELGLNLKPLEAQAAFGLVQLDKLPEFIQARERNFKELDGFLRQYPDLFILPKKVDANAKPSWFSYPLTVKTNKFTRNDIVKYLEKNMIQTRPFFAGNLLRHPIFYGNPALKGSYSISGQLTNSDKITESSFFVGVYPGINKEMMGYMKKVFKDFISKYS